MEFQDTLLALISVDGSTNACADHGDLAMVALLKSYYAHVAQLVAPENGQIVKVLGDGVLVMFPTEQPASALASLSAAHSQLQTLWHDFDPRCTVRMRATIGQVLTGPLGPPGREQHDIYGNTLNQLFRLPAGELVLSEALQARVRHRRKRRGT